MEAPVHWLTRVARTAGFTGADQLTIDPKLAVADAWALVADKCDVEMDDLAQAVAKSFRLECADLSKAEATAIPMLPAAIARDYGVYPVREFHRHLVVATSNPTDTAAEQQIGFACGRTPILQIASPDAIHDLIDQTYAPDRAVETLLKRIDPKTDASVVEVVEDEPEPDPTLELAEEAGTGPIVRLTNMILQEAIEKGASDIHIQPLPNGGVVRMRIDGVLRTGVRVPLSVLVRVISRIKIMSRLNIADRLRPQDGKARIQVGGKKFELRVSTVPTRGSEKAVIRILDPLQTGMLDDTGLAAREVERFRRMLRNRDGIVVVTGPTGSGKTTTMYAALREIATEGVNIMTVEDPVEYELPGLTQIQVDAKQGVVFQTALRAILRQDPDVIFIGEIRDHETAEIAAQASLTGHLVLATIHANDAVGSVRRFLDLGLEAATIAEVMRSSLAQRLIRTVCADCAGVIEGDLLEEEAVLAKRFAMHPVVRAVGCDECGMSGYRGRRPVVEIITPSPDFLKLISQGASHVDLVMQAKRDGMRTMLEGALDLVKDGKTTLAEVERVVGEEDLTTAFRGNAGTAVPGTAAAARMPASERAAAMPNPPVGAGPVPPTPSRAVFNPAPEDEEEPMSHALVVDDDADTRYLVRAVLESHGWLVTEAKDGFEALSHLQTEKVDLIVLDLMMPRVNGHEVLRAAKGSLATAGIPILVLTSQNDRSMEVRVLKEGADDYIRKPVDPAVFTNRVQAALRRARA